MEAEGADAADGEEFDDALFVRQGHAMVPTPLAQNSIDPVRSALRTLEVTLNKAHHFDPGRTRRRMVIALPSSRVPMDGRNGANPATVTTAAPA